MPQVQAASCVIYNGLQLRRRRKCDAGHVDPSDCVAESKARFSIEDLAERQVGASAGGDLRTKSSHWVIFSVSSATWDEFRRFIPQLWLYRSFRSRHA